MGGTGEVSREGPGIAATKGWAAQMSVAAFLEPWHAEVGGFLRLKKKHGAEEERGGIGEMGRGEVAGERSHTYEL